MFYTIYQVTNKINNKIYIGQHQTENLDDGYLGSGKAIKDAINKYGKENFEKKILHVFKTEEEMNSKEIELVTEEFSLRNDTYNMCAGGNDNIKGAHLGIKHSEEAKRKIGLKSKGRKPSEETKRKLSLAQKGKSRSYVSKVLKGVPKSEEHKRRLSESLKKFYTINASVV